MPKTKPYVWDCFSLQMKISNKKKKTQSGKICYKVFIVVFLINTNCYVILMLFYSIRQLCIAIFTKLCMSVFYQAKKKNPAAVVQSKIREVEGVR